MQSKPRSKIISCERDFSGPSPMVGSSKRRIKLTRNTPLELKTCMDYIPALYASNFCWIDWANSIFRSQSLWMTKRTKRLVYFVNFVHIFFNLQAISNGWVFAQCGTKCGNLLSNAFHLSWTCTLQTWRVQTLKSVRRIQWKYLFFPNIYMKTNKNE